jgi:hypothetical protein
MKKINVNVVVERGSDNKYSAYMDYYDLDFGLAGFGDTAQDAIADFYEAYEEEKIMCTKEGKKAPELEFDIRYSSASDMRKPRHGTVMQVERGQHSFAGDLKQVHLTS